MPTRRAKIARYGLTALGIFAVLGLLIAVKGCQIATMVASGRAAQRAGPPPEAVSTMLAEEQSWEALLPSIGSVASGKGVALSADAPGVVTRIHFESGAMVKRGQMLVELDTNLERAQLAATVARRALAATNLARSRALAATGSIPPAQLDADDTQLRTAATDVDALKAQIAKKTIVAPFTGKLGLRAVNLGQYLNPGTPVTVLETVETMYVDFTLPQQRLGDVAVGMPARILLENDAGSPIDGRITAIDPTVDPATRSVKLRADVDNASAQLRPGMFATVSVVLPRTETVVAVPATAIVHAPYGDSIFIVEDKKPDAGHQKSARQQFVRLGAARGDFVAVLDGVQAKQEVVIAGAFKLRNNSPIAVDNSKAPKPELDPHLENR